MADYKESPLATPLKTLDPNEYFNLSPEFRRIQEERTAIRSNLKRQYQTLLNNPHRKELIEDPAVTKWVYARANPYPNFRPSYKTSLLGVVCGVFPLFAFYYLFKTDRDARDAKIKAGTYKRPFTLLN